MTRFGLVPALLAIALSGPVAAEGIAEDIADLIVLCEACHGPNGVSEHPDVPTIAGQAPDYLNRTLRSYQVWGRPCIKSGFRFGDTERPKTDMCEVAEGLTGEEVDALATHFGAQPFRSADQAFDPALAETGKALHEEFCETCHHQGGLGTERAPRLAGQWTTYLKTALRFVPSGEHLVPPAMETTVNELSAEDIDALMNFYASQQE